MGKFTGVTFVTPKVKIRNESDHTAVLYRGKYGIDLRKNDEMEMQIGDAINALPPVIFSGIEYKYLNNEVELTLTIRDPIE